MNLTKKAFLTSVVLAGTLGATVASAANFSFAGTFAADDNVQLFNFSVGAASSVTLVSYGYAGGTQANGNVVARGGFDTILALFDAGTGVLIGQNDDSIGAVCGGVPVAVDSVTGRRFDTCLNSNLAAGNYIVAVMEFDNFAVGPNISAGFTRTGQGNFTGLFGCSNGRFCDVSPNNRTNAWSFDILNVSAATQNTVPEPATLGLLGLGLAGLGFVRRKRQA